MYINILQRGNLVAVVTDGTAVLGLGDIGPEAALPVMEGKCVLFKEFGDVDAIPICLDTKDTEEIIRTVKLIAPGLGGINLEDISAPRCIEIETRLKEELEILSKYIVEPDYEDKIKNDNKVEKHLEWIKNIMKKHENISSQNAHDILKI